MEVKKFASSEGNVWKYVFHFEGAVAEAVLYRYESFEKRTVICCSVQSGCPVGCSFCGTGGAFIRDLTMDEIVSQITHILADNELNNKTGEIEKFQIMFMSMGEPMLNMDNVIMAVRKLSFYYNNADLLISTVGINNVTVINDLLELAKSISKVGLQFSLHRGYEKERRQLIPFKKILSLRELRDFGLLFKVYTGRKVFLNYCVTEHNVNLYELEAIKDLFSPLVFNMTFSVVCQADETMKDAVKHNYTRLQLVTDSFLEDGYDCRMFDPAGQDDIGGGCGQLWYVQKYLKNT